MKPWMLAFVALIASGAPVKAARAAEVLCRELPLVAEPELGTLQKEFNGIATKAARWTTASPIPEPCQRPMAPIQALYEAVFRYRIEFVTERLPLCDAGTGLPTRMVDAVNDPVSGLIRIWDQAWKDGLEYEKQLISTHELAGIAGQINEPWTTSICWMFVPLLPGVKTTVPVELPSLPNIPLLLLAGGGGGGGGGSTGGHGGGDVKMAGFKFRALTLLLAEMPVLNDCGMTDAEFEPAFGGWLRLELRDPEAWKATDAQVLIQTLELGKGRKASEQERACLENAKK